MIKILITAISLLVAQMTSAQICKDTIPASTPDSRFVVNGDEVTDTGTGLIWQRCSLGQTGSDCTGFPGGYTWEEALQAASAPWRLPNINELRSIVEERCYDPAINLTVFPSESSPFSSYFWSSSPYANDSNHAWDVGFHIGVSSHWNKSYTRSVRLVRDGQ